MICKFCGTKISDSLTTCPGCGASILVRKTSEKNKIDESSVIQEEIKKTNVKQVYTVCKFCGTKITNQGLSCPGCGVSLGVIQKNNKTKEYEKSNDEPIQNIEPVSERLHKKNSPIENSNSTNQRPIQPSNNPVKKNKKISKSKAFIALFITLLIIFVFSVICLKGIFSGYEAPSQVAQTYSYYKLNCDFDKCMTIDMWESILIPYVTLNNYMGVSMYDDDTSNNDARQIFKICDKYVRDHYSSIKHNSTFVIEFYKTKDEGWEVYSHYDSNLDRFEHVAFANILDSID